MKKITLLVTGVGSFVANSVISNFKNINDMEIRIIGCDIKDYVSSYNLLNSYYKIPKFDDINYIDRLLDILKTENVDIIVPLIDSEVMKIYNNKDKFIDYKLLMISSNNMNIITDKGLLYDYLNFNNIGVPRYYKVSNIKTFIKACNELDYKDNIICFKPTISSGSRGFRIIDNSVLEYELLCDKPNSAYISYKNAKNILKKKRNFDEILVMEYIPDEIYTVHLLADKGIIKYCVICKIIREVSSNMVETEIVQDDKILNYCIEIVRLLEIDNIFGIQIKKDKKGNIKMIEINPRIQGSISVCNSIGINMPYLAIKKLLNEEYTNIAIIDNKYRIIRCYQENYILLNQIKK